MLTVHGMCSLGTCRNKWRMLASLDIPSLIISIIFISYSCKALCDLQTRNNV